MRLSELLREYRRDHSLSQRDFAKQCGEKITSGYISMLENEKNPATGKKIRPSLGTYDVLARGMGITVDKLFNLINDVPVTLTDEETLPDKLIPISKINNGHRVPVIGSTTSLRIDGDSDSSDKTVKSVRIPVLGTIPAGIPIEAIEDVLDWEEISIEMTRGGKEYFALQIRGDSMYPRYEDQDVVIFRKQDTCENGQDCAVMVNGDDATFKRVRISEKGVTLQPLNPKYEPKVYSNEEVLDLPVRVIGVAVELRRKF